MPTITNIKTGISYEVSEEDFINIQNSVLAKNYGIGIYNGSINKSSLAILLEANKLVPNRIYILNDATSEEIKIILTAKTSNSFYKKCTLVDDDFDLMEYDFLEDEFTGIDFLAGTIRNSGGTWAYVDDSEHDKRNLDTLTTNTNDVTISYRRDDYNRVISLLVAPDESYAIKGIICGASVGLAFSNIKLQRNYSNYGYVYFDGTNFQILYSKGISTATFNLINGELTINHEPFEDEAILSIVGRNGTYIPQMSEFGNNFTRLKFYDYEGNVILVPDANMIVQFSRGYNKQLSSEEAEIENANIWISGQMKKVIS